MTPYLIGAGLIAIAAAVAAAWIEHYREMAAIEAALHPKHFPRHEHVTGWRPDLPGRE